MFCSLHLAFRKSVAVRGDNVCRAQEKLGFSHHSHYLLIFISWWVGGAWLLVQAMGLWCSGDPGSLRWVVRVTSGLGALHLQSIGRPIGEREESE